MINLAGNPDCDNYIIEELKQAHISLNNKIDKVRSEVPYTVTGVLNNFEFRRAWYYWVVTGYMPLKYAKDIYNNYKDLSIRACGHCKNPPPEDWCDPKNYMEICKPIIEKAYNEEISFEEANKKCNKLRKQGEQFISHYHIDTQEGLNKFAEIIYENNIIG